MSEEVKSQIPYVAFATFNNALNSLHTIPPKLNKGIWTTYAGSVQNQLWSAFRFFELVAEDGTPSLRLDKLVNEKDRRAENLAELLKDYFPALAALDLSKITAQHFGDVMRSYKLGGETTKKASSFYLQAAKAAGMSLSPYLLRTTRTPGPKRTKKPPVPPVKIATPKDNFSGVERQAPLIQTGPFAEVSLVGGGKLFLSADRDVFSMKSDARKFVMGLLDQLEAYEEANSLGLEEEPEDEEN